MSKLPSRIASLEDIQRYVLEICAERGFAHDPMNKFVMLTEEVGELAKAYRKTCGMKFSKSADKLSLEEEIADVLITLLAFANTLDIDVYQAFAAKESKNRKRVWK